VSRATQRFAKGYPRLNLESLDGVVEETIQREIEKHSICSGCLVEKNGRIRIILLNFSSNLIKMAASIYKLAMSAKLCT